MFKAKCLHVMLFVVVGVLGSSSLYAKELPEKSKSAIEQLLPGATVKSIDTETEKGAKYFSVEVVHNGKKIDVEVSADGVIGEVENFVSGSEVPQSVLNVIAKNLKVIRIEKHVRYGVPASGKLVTLKSPITFYDIKYKSGGKKRSLIVDEDGKVNPSLDWDQSDLKKDDKDDEDDGDDEEDDD